MHNSITSNVQLMQFKSQHSHIQSPFPHLDTLYFGKMECNIEFSYAMKIMTKAIRPNENISWICNAHIRAEYKRQLGWTYSSIRTTNAYDLAKSPDMAFETLSMACIPHLYAIFAFVLHSRKIIRTINADKSLDCNASTCYRM